VALHNPMIMAPSGADPTIYNTQAEYRRLYTSFCQVPTGVDILEGVLGNSFAVTQRGAGANFSVDISVGRAFIQDDDTSANGIYQVWSDATFNLVTPGAPGSGTRVHRVVLQMRNKGENGAWATYDFTPVLLQDTGSGTPAQPASAITLAFVSIATGQASVLNANITDYRQRADTITVTKPGDTSRSSATQVIDPDLQLLNLAANATYNVKGLLIQRADANPGGIIANFTASAGSVMRYFLVTIGLSNATIGSGYQGADSWQSYGSGITLDGDILFDGVLYTGAAPASVSLLWGRLSATANNTVLKQYSYLSARRIG
jgi:hypothetical protein